MLYRLIVIIAALAALMVLPGIAAAQAPAQTPAATPAPPAAAPAAPAPQQPQAMPQCQMGPGGTCVVPGQATPEQTKQMQEKMAQCCAMMQQGKGCPMHQQMQKQMDDLQKRIEALEGKKGKKK
jgi:hypothetical protein